VLHQGLLRLVFEIELLLERGKQVGWEDVVAHAVGDGSDFGWERESRVEVVQEVAEEAAGRGGNRVVAIY